MRKIKLGAIQPAYQYVSERYDCMSPAYVNDAAEIVEKYVKTQLDISFGLVDQAGREGCGIVTTCEDATGIGNFGGDVTEKNIFPLLVELTEPLAETGFSALARKHGMYVLACYYRKTGGSIYNVATLFDRQGRISGEYRKTHLPSYEKWQVAEGNTLGSIDTDFGKIGVCICYDIMFPECIQTVALAGAEVVFHPTVGYGWYDSIGEATLRTRANDHSVYLVTSKSHLHMAAGKSSIIDPWGQVLVDAGFYRNVIVTKEVDLDDRKAHPDWHYGARTSGILEIRERYLHERRPELYSAIAAVTHERLGDPGREFQLEMIELTKAGKIHW